MTEKKTASTTTPVALSKEELTAGLVFEREISAAQAAMQQAHTGRAAFTSYLKAVKGVPGDWEIRDWEIGFEAPEAQP